MAIQLDHVIVSIPPYPVLPRPRSLAGLLDVPWQESHGRFTPVT